MSHWNDLYQTALYMTRDNNDALDLVQDTYERAYRFFNTFKKGTNIRAWLYRILKNTFISEIRRDKRRSVIEYAINLEDVPESMKVSRDSAPDSITEDEFSYEIEKIFDSMPGEFSQAVLLADVEGLSYKEIAAVMDSPVGTVMSRLHRGRRLLRENSGVQKLWRNHLRGAKDSSRQQMSGI